MKPGRGAGMDGWTPGTFSRRALTAWRARGIAYKLRLSVPMLRYFDEDYLRAKIPGNDRFAKSHQDSFSSVWIEKVQ